MDIIAIQYLDYPMYLAVIQRSGGSASLGSAPVSLCMQLNIINFNILHELTSPS